MDEEGDDGGDVDTSEDEDGDESLLELLQMLECRLTWPFRSPFILW